MTALPNISTGDLKEDRRVFLDWCATAYSALTICQDNLAGVIHASFDNLLTMNKDNPAAWAKLKELHDADIAKLQAMLRPLED